MAVTVYGAPKQSKGAYHITFDKTSRDAICGAYMGFQPEEVNPEAEKPWRDGSWCKKCKQLYGDLKALAAESGKPINEVRIDKRRGLNRHEDHREGGQYASGNICDICGKGLRDHYTPAILEAIVGEPWTVCRRCHDRKFKGQTITNIFIDVMGRLPTDTELAKLEDEFGKGYLGGED